MKVVTIDRPVKDVDGVLVALRSEKPPMAVADLKSSSFSDRFLLRAGRLLSLLGAALLATEP